MASRLFAYVFGFGLLGLGGFCVDELLHWLYNHIKIEEDEDEKENGYIN